MSVKGNVIQLCKEKGVTVAAIERSTGIANGTISKWNEDTVPNGQTLVALAEYFEVTTDFLLGRSARERFNDAVSGKDGGSPILFRFAGRTDSEQVTDHDIELIMRTIDAVRANPEKYGLRREDT